MIDDNPDEYLRQAIALAGDNVRTGEGGPYGALIVRNRQVLAACANKVTRDNDPTSHAEIMAIRAACKATNDYRLSGCILYTSCEPCPMCLGAIYWARIEKVYFACDRHDAAKANFDDSFIYDDITLPPSARAIPMIHVNLPQSTQPFELWLAAPNKILY